MNPCPAIAERIILLEEWLNIMKKTLLGLAFFGVVGAANAAVIFSEDFNGGNTGAFGVTAINAVAWDDMFAFSYDNWTGATASTTDNAMTASSDFAGTTAGFDTSATAAVGGSGFTGLVLDYDVNFQNFGGGADRLEVWAGTNLIFTHTADTPGSGSLFAAPGAHFTHSLASVDNSNFNLVFRYVDESASTWEWYAQVDNVAVSGTAVPEPATMAALGLGVAALLRRRRK